MKRCDVRVRAPDVPSALLLCERLPGAELARAPGGQDVDVVIHDGGRPSVVAQTLSAIEAWVRDRSLARIQLWIDDHRYSMAPIQVDVATTPEPDL